MKRVVKRKLDRILAFVLAVVLVVGSMPLSGGVIAEEDPEPEQTAFSDTVDYGSDDWFEYRENGLELTPSLFGITVTVDAAPVEESQTGGQNEPKAESETKKISYSYKIVKNDDELVSLEGNQVTFGKNVGQATFGIVKHEGEGTEETSEDLVNTYSITVKYVDLPSGSFTLKDILNSVSDVGSADDVIMALEYLVVTPKNGWKVATSISNISKNEEDWATSLQLDYNVGSVEYGGVIYDTNVYFFKKGTGIALWSRRIQYIHDNVKPSVQFVSIDGNNIPSSDVEQLVICYDGTIKNTIDCVIKITDDHYTFDPTIVNNVPEASKKVRFYYGDRTEPLTIKNCKNKGNDQYQFTLELPVEGDYSAYGLKVEVEDDLGNKPEKPEDRVKASNTFIEQFSLKIKYYYVPNPNSPNDNDDQNGGHKDTQNDVLAYLQEQPCLRFEFYGEKLPSSDTLKTEYRFPTRTENYTPTNPDYYIPSKSEWKWDGQLKCFYLKTQTPNWINNDNNSGYQDYYYRIMVQGMVDDASRDLNTHVFHYRIDNVKPVMDIDFVDAGGNLIAASDNQYSAENPKVLIKITEIDLDTSKIKVYMDDSEDPISNVAWTKKDNTYTGTIQNLTNGEHTFKIVGMDKAGNGFKLTDHSGENHPKRENYYDTISDDGKTVTTKTLVVDDNKPKVTPVFSWRGEWKKTNDGWHYVRTVDFSITAESKIASLSEMGYQVDQQPAVIYRNREGEDGFKKWTRKIENVELKDNLQPLGTYKVWAKTRAMSSGDLVEGVDWDGTAPVITVTADNTYRLNVFEDGNAKVVNLFTNATSLQDDFKIEIVEKNLNPKRVNVIIDDVPYTIVEMATATQEMLESAGSAKILFLEQDPEDGSKWVINNIHVSCGEAGENREHPIVISCFDKTGNPGQGINEFSQAFMDGLIVFDTELPVITVTPMEEDVKHSAVEGEEGSEITVPYYDKLNLRYLVTVNDKNPSMEEVWAVVYRDANMTQTVAISNQSLEPVAGKNNQVFLSFTVPEEGKYYLKVFAKDGAGNVGESALATFIADSKKPEVDDPTYPVPCIHDYGDEITYGKQISLRVYAKDSMTKITRFDYCFHHDFGVDESSHTTDVFYDEQLKKWYADIELPLNMEGEFKATVEYWATDEVGHESSKKTTVMINIDTVAPIFSCEIETEHSSYSNDVLYYSDGITLKLWITESSFEKTYAKVTDNDEVKYVDWKRVSGTTNVYEGTLPLDQFGEHNVVVSYNDAGINDMEAEEGVDLTAYGTLEGSSFTFKRIIIDDQSPKVSIRLQDAEDVTKNLDGEIGDGEDYDSVKYCVIKVFEDYFDEELVELKVQAVDLSGNTVTPNAFTEWQHFENDTVHAIVLPVTKDGIYTVSVEQCSDKAGREFEAFDGEKSEITFVVDLTAPTDAVIHYSIPLNHTNVTGLNADDLIAVSEDPAYYNKPIKAKFIAKENASEVVKFKYKFIPLGTEDASQIQFTSVDAERNGTTVSFEAVVNLPEQESPKYLLKGKFEVWAINKAGMETLCDNDVTVVIDNQSPVMLAPDYYEKLGDDVFYYRGDARVQIKIQEDNFFGSDVKVSLKKDSDEAEKIPQKDDDWELLAPEAVGGEQNVYAQTFTMTAEGEYLLTVEYADRSHNEMIENNPFTTTKMVVDKTDPVITADVMTGSAVNNMNGVRYYNANQTLVISVKERNFDKSSVLVSISAVGIDGRSILSEELRGGELTWSDSGDVHTANVSLATDGIYSVTAKCSDLAGRTAKDYVASKFVIDKTAPTGLTITYGNPVFTTNEGGVAYDYYNAPVSVVITAADDVSGIVAFEYKFTRADGVSGVNAQIDTVVVGEGQLNYSAGRTNATYSFNLPGATLSANGQLNGKLEVKAINRSALESVVADTKRIIADNLVPVIHVEYNDHVNEIGNTWYFNEKINSTVSIDEANFVRDEVAFRVVRNGSENTPAINWTDRPGDRHFTDFELSQEGRYEVILNYADRSGNAAAGYKSNLLVVDTIAPVIELVGVTNEMASKAEKIGFVLTISDENLDLDAVKFSLKSEVVDKSGETKRFDLTDSAKMEVSSDGKTVTFTIENLEQDAVYTMSCSAVDKAKNKTEEIRTEDTKDYEKIIFSVNRNGSNYIVSPETEAFIGSFSKNPIDLVVEEINPNQLHNIKITLFKNGETIELKEGKDYQLKKTGSATTWYRYTYTLSKAIFEADGIYSVSFYSEDAAGNVSNNTLDNKNVEISFGVDNTNPSVIITNVEDGVTYPVESLEIVVQANDNLKLSQGVAYLDGKEYASWNEKDIADLVAKGQDFSFAVSDESVKAHSLRIVMTDAAGNVTEKEVGGFYVTTNLWIRYVNNKPLLYGSIAGFVVLVLGLGFLIGAKRRKRAR